MFIIVILSLSCCVFLIIHSFIIKKQIINISNQLNNYNNLKTHKKIDISLYNKHIENLASNINKHIDINIQTQINQKNAEYELKSAIANISHDLRTPLTSIIGYIEMIKYENISKDKQNEYINIALKESYCLKSLLNDFFELSTVESPEYKLKIEFVNVNNILYEVLTSFYDKFTNKNINPEIAIINKNLIVLGNHMAIKRVIENLINNIIKHSSKKVFISLKQSNNMAVLTTINLAYNISKKDVNLIFNRFYKTDISRKNRNNTGLGLPIVKSLMNKMNGEVYAEIHENLLHIFCKWQLK